MGPMGRRLDRLFTEVGDLADVSKRVAVNQAEQGRRRWSDFEYVGADGLEPHRSRILASVPLAVARRRADPDVGYWREHWPDLPMILASPSGEPIDAKRESVIEQIQQRGRTRDADPEYEWASIRLALGADRGEDLRQRCWAMQHGVPVLSAEVIERSSTPQQGPCSPMLTVTEAESQAVSLRVQSLAPFLAAALVLGPPSPLIHAQSFTPLELAVLVDPSGNPPWLSAQGRATLAEGFIDSDNRATRTQTPAQVMVAARVLWRSAHTDPAALAYRRHLHETYSPVALMFARMGCEPWPKDANSRH